jgi:hypothetical protein
LVNLTSHVSPAPSEMLRYKIGGAYSEAHQHYNSDREGVALGNPDDDDDDEKKDGDTDTHTTTCGFGGPAPALLSFRCMGATVGEGEGRGKGANSDDRLVHLLTRMGAGIANCLPNTSLAPSAWVKGQITQDRSRWGLCDSVNNYESQQRGMRAVVVMLTWLIDLVLTESPLTLNGGGRSGSSRDCQESSLAGAGAGAGAYSADSPDRVASALRLVHLLLSVGINNGTFRVQPDTESFYMHADCLPALLTMHPRLSAFIPWIRACALGSSNSSGNIHHPHRHRQLLSSIIMSGLSRTYSVLLFFLAFLPSVSLYRYITVCLHSLTPYDTSLTIIPLPRSITNQHNTSLVTSQVRSFGTLGMCPWQWLSLLSFQGL